MGNPIKYSDLISPDDSIRQLIGELTETNKVLESVMATARSNAGALRSALSATDPGTAEGRKQILALSEEISRLTARVKTLESALKQNSEARREATRLANAGRVATRESIRAKLEEKASIKQLTDEIKRKMSAERNSAATAVESLTKTKIQTMSYNELSAVYSDLKMQINAMTAKTKEETAAREQAAAVAKNVYEQMNILQEMTGRHTLSVGNYAKSWNGLNLAFQQIMREVPNISMGFNMFFLAISNNIPILTDQIRIAKAKYRQDMQNIAAMELEIQKMRQAGVSAEIYTVKVSELNAAKKAAVPVGKQLLSSLFSWQTALVLGITFLTMYGGKLLDNIIKTRRATDEQKLYNDALTDFSKKGAEASAKLELLYEVSTDVTASIEDRRDATESLMKLYPKVFENFSKEEIMAGRAKAAYDELRESIFKAAMAQAAMQKMSELAGKIVEAQIKLNRADEIATKKGLKSGAELKEMVDEQHIQRAAAIGLSTGAVGPASFPTEPTYTKLSEEEKEGAKAFKEGTEEMEAALIQREQIKKIMEDEDLFGFLFDEKKGGGSGGGGKEHITELLAPLYDYEKYWRQTKEAMLGTIKDDEQREIALSRFKYDTKIEDLMAYRDNQESILTEIAAIDERLQGDITKETREELKKRRNDLVKDLKLNKEGISDMTSYILTQIEEREKAISDITKKYADKRVRARMKEVDNNLKIGKLEIGALQISEDEKNAMLAKAEIEAWDARIAIMKQNTDIFSKEEIELAIATVNELIANFPHPQGETENGSWFQSLFKIDQTQLRDLSRFVRELGRIANNIINNIAAVIDAYKREAEAARDAAQAQVDAANRVYEAELQAYENGYANNVEYARRELELQKKKREEAQKEVEKYERMQQELDALSQVSSMITASASLFKASAPLGPIGVGIATAATIAMFASFAAMRVKASQLVRAEKYGEGMSEYIDYGGSHASGNDVDFGQKKDGTRRRIERGEMVAVFNARNTRKYGVDTLSSIVSSINKGVFEKTYSNAFSALDGYSIDISQTLDSRYFGKMANDISAIRKDGTARRYDFANGVMVERYKNRIRKIRTI